MQLRRYRKTNKGRIVWASPATPEPHEDIILVPATKKNLISALLYADREQHSDAPELYKIQRRDYLDPNTPILLIAAGWGLLVTDYHPQGVQSDEQLVDELIEDGEITKVKKIKGEYIVSLDEKKIEYSCEKYTLAESLYLAVDYFKNQTCKSLNCTEEK